MQEFAAAVETFDKTPPLLVFVEIAMVQLTQGAGIGVWGK